MRWLIPMSSKPISGNEDSSILAVNDLHVSYGPVKAVRGVSLRADGVSIVAVLGANGAGKTTLLNAIAGLHTPSSGEVIFSGTRIDGMPAHRVTQRGLSLVPEGRRLFPEMTVAQNLKLSAGASKRGADATDWEVVLTLFPVLRTRIDQRAGTLSGGEQQMLAVGRALLARPRLLLLDEPSMGLSPKLVSIVFEKLREIREHGTAIVIVEQNVREALDAADYAYVLRNGVVGAEGPAEEIASRKDLADLYLGHSV
jgi:branched-chain amino acid transport system ATP-binding protein